MYTSVERLSGGLWKVEQKKKEVNQSYAVEEKGGAIQGPRRCGVPLRVLKMEGNSMIK